MKSKQWIRVPLLPETSISGTRMEEGEVFCQIDQDPSLAYERKAWLYLLTLPISWLMTLGAMLKTLFYKFVLKHQPPSTSILFDRFSRPLRDIRLGAASWKALDIIYHWFDPDWRFDHYANLGFFEELLADFWIGMINAQAVRNRFKLASREISRAIDRLLPRDEIRIFSIAAGSGEVILKEMVKRKQQGIVIRALLLDFDPTACEYARELADRYGVTDQIEVIRANIRQIEAVLEQKQFRPDIIEMLGFLDYRPREKAVTLINRIWKLLPSGGVFFTCHIRRNPERWFLRWVISWWMIYRQPQELANLIAEGGFAPDQVRLLYEPQTVHGIAIATKTNGG